MVGGGPAGCAAAIVLASAGASVVVFERSAGPRTPIGETLPPEVRMPLDRLGLWERFLTDGHLQSPGVMAAWGRSEPYVNDFILNPYGCGWRVDRNRFDATLAAGAAAAGAVVRAGTTVDRCRRGDGGAWQLNVDVTAGFLVDAAGRSPSPAGAGLVVHDRMVALVGVAPAAGEDRWALLEATEEGWWYSARLPDGRLVMTFQTNAGPGLRRRWHEFLAVAPATAARARGPTDDVRIVSANSHRRHPIAGEGWLAVGDAATAHDPITGLGILWALESAIAGAEAMLGSTVAAYARAMGDRFDRYLETRVQYYRGEHRWPHAPFWRGRR